LIFWEISWYPNEMELAYPITVIVYEDGTEKNKKKGEYKRGG